LSGRPDREIIPALETLLGDRVNVMPSQAQSSGESARKILVELELQPTPGIAG
jgi:hypothetical protein